MTDEILYVPAEGDRLRLVEITTGNYLAVLRLKVAEDQRRFVDSNAVSLVQGHYHANAWFRAIYEDDCAVGFVMLHNPRRDPEAVPRERSRLFVWRLMIDRAHQRRGLGRRVIRILADIARSNRFTHLCVDFVEAEGGPGPFYEACGFQRSGRIVDGEVEACLDLNVEGS